MLTNGLMPWLHSVTGLGTAMAAAAQLAKLGVTQWNLVFKITRAVGKLLGF